MRHEHPGQPWHSFFLDIDKTLDQPVALQCLGGFAMAMLYDLPRPTVDVDFLSVIPAGYEDRLIPIFPAAYRRVQLTGLEAHDLVLSKLERNSGRDREDVKFLARAAPLDLRTLNDRYRSELRPHLAATEALDRDAAAAIGRTP